MIWTGQDWSELVRAGQGWSGLIRNVYPDFIFGKSKMDYRAFGHHQQHLRKPQNAVFTPHSGPVCSIYGQSEPVRVSRSQSESVNVIRLSQL